MNSGVRERDHDDQTREWSARFEEEFGSKPTMVHAGVYSGTMHYLAGVEATGSTDGDVVAEWMKGHEFDDPLFGKGYVREDGRVIHDMHLYEVKTPDESTGEWDLYNLVSTIPGEEAFLPMEGSGCAFVNES